MNPLNPFTFILQQEECSHKPWVHVLKNLIFGIFTIEKEYEVLFNSISSLFGKQYKKSMHDWNAKLHAAI